MPLPAPKHVASGLAKLDVSLVTDDSTASTALANTQLLELCNLSAAHNNMIVQLPTGTIHIGYDDPTKAAIHLDERFSGLTIQGNGRSATLLVNRQDTANPLVLRSTRIPPARSITGYATPGNNTMTVSDPEEFATYNIGDVVYFWHEQYGPTPSPSQLLRVTGLSGSTVTLSGTISTTIGIDVFVHISNGAAVSGSSAIGTEDFTLVLSSQASLFSVGDDVFLTDGPGAMICVGEWARVSAISSGVITLDRPVVRAYRTALTCLVPPPHMTDITIRDLSIAVPASGSEFTPFGYAEFGTRIRFDNVDFVQGPSGGGEPQVFGFSAIGELTLTNLTTAGTFAFNACLQVLGSGIRARGIFGEEYCIEMYFSHIVTFGTEGFVFSNNQAYGGAGLECTRIFLTDSLINGAGPSKVSFNDDSTFTNVEIVNYGETVLYANANNCIVINLKSDVPIHFRGDYWRLAYLTAPSIVIEDYSTTSLTKGILLTPLLPDPEDVTYDLADAHQFRKPVFAYSDALYDLGEIEAETLKPNNVAGKIPVYHPITRALRGYIVVYEDFA